MRSARAVQQCLARRAKFEFHRRGRGGGAVPIGESARFKLRSLVRMFYVCDFHSVIFMMPHCSRGSLLFTRHFVS